MKETNYFFALLFISSGTLLLLNSLDIFYYDFSAIRDYWAVSFIFFGLSIIIENVLLKKVLMSLLGIFISLIAFSFYSLAVFEF